jgi:Orthoreovirus membrane fusion protein p10
VRNTYTLLDFGNWIESSNDQGNPYVQLLSVTDINAAHADFVNVRLNGVDTTGSAQYALLPPSQMQHSPVSAAEKKAEYQEMILSHWPYIFAGCLAIVVILIGVCIWKCCCRRCAKKKTKKTDSFILPKSDNSIYVALESQGGRSGAYGNSQYSLHGKDYV